MNVQCTGVVDAVGIGNTAGFYGSIASSYGQAIVRAGVVDAVGIRHTAGLFSVNVLFQ